MHNPPLILIVDDKETNREILRARLRAQGYELLEAADGEVALSIARQQHPDLILLDVLMPKIDGLEVCRRLKSDTDLPFIPIVLVTAMVDSKDVVAGLEAGADEYLTKPVDQAALVARVRSMLRVKELTDQVRAQAADKLVDPQPLKTGNLLAGIGMGVRVHLKKLIVGVMGECASSCALIWIGGETGRKFFYQNRPGCFDVSLLPPTR